MTLNTGDITDNDITLTMTLLTVNKIYMLGRNVISKVIKNIVLMSNIQKGARKRLK
jgi:hypothetical protein